MGGEEKGGNDGQERKEVRMNEMFEYPIVEDMVQSPIVKVVKYVGNVVDFPVTWIRENLVERFRGPKYHYYHQKFKRVPTIDQCYTDDHGCIYEANEQYKRDKKVDEQILNILRNRLYNCIYWKRGVNEYYNHDKLCPKERAEYDGAEINYFIKYGDLGAVGVCSNVIGAFYKQKHRLIWERRQAEKGIDVDMWQTGKEGIDVNN